MLLRTIEDPVRDTAAVIGVTVVDGSYKTRGEEESVSVMHIQKITDVNRDDLCASCQYLKSDMKEPETYKHDYHF